MQKGEMRKETLSTDNLQPGDIVTTTEGDHLLYYIIEKVAPGKTYVQAAEITDYGTAKEMFTNAGGIERSRLTPTGVRWTLSHVLEAKKRHLGGMSATTEKMWRETFSNLVK
jgi:hypothetical protein